MNRIFLLQSALLAEIDKYKEIQRTNSPSLNWERIHLISCGKVGYLLGLERGLDPVLSACACSLHDYGRIVTGSQENHGAAGVEPTRALLARLQLFNEKEVAQILLAVENHSQKGVQGGRLEELVKDADLLDYHSYGHKFTRPEQVERFNRVWRFKE